MLQMNTEPIIESPMAYYNRCQPEDSADGQFEDAPEELEAALATPDRKNRQNIAKALINVSPTDGIKETASYETRLDEDGKMIENIICGTSDHKVNSPRNDTEAKRKNKDESFAMNSLSPGGIYDNEIREEDVLFGRGSRTNYHAGNKYFRSLVGSARLQYAATPKMHKSSIASAIVHKVKLRKGRFLKKDEKTGKWVEVCDTKARLKTSQALREGLALKTRQALQLTSENIQS